MAWATARLRRVSTTDQQPYLQADAFQRAGCYRVFTETASGARTDRAILEQLLDQLRPGDTLVVWKLNQLATRCATWSTPLPDSPTAESDSGACRGRSTPPPRRQAGLPHVAALAEFERDLIQERTSAGLAAARARGRCGGRPSVMTAYKVRVAQEMYRSG